jgi:hypothetical protein
VAALPVPAPGTASVPLPEGAVVFEPVAGEVHVLNGSGAVVWAACCDGIDRESLLDELEEVTALPLADLAVQVDGCLARFRDDGLVIEPGVEPAGPAGARRDWVRTEPAGAGPHRVRFRVLGEVVEVCAASAPLLDEVRSRCADLVTDAEPSLWAPIHDEPDGRVRLDGPRVGSRYHADQMALLDDFLAELNVATAAWTGGLALHAGAVRHPSGTIVGLPGVSGAGKSTLVGALVRAGWDYLTDEAFGLDPSLSVVGYPKPLALDPTSRGLLGVAAATDDVPVRALRPDVRVLAGVVGPLGLLVLPVRVADGGGGRPASVVEIDPGSRLTSLSPHALNLRASGVAGLAAMVGASRMIRTFRLVYADPTGAVEALAALVGGRHGPS